MLCKSAPTVDTRYSQENPTIVMGVTEIAQAPPTPDPTPRLQGPDGKKRLTIADVRSIGQPEPATSKGQLPRHSSYYDDVEDVDFKE